MYAGKTWGDVSFESAHLELTELVSCGSTETQSCCPLYWGSCVKRDLYSSLNWTDPNTTSTMLPRQHLGATAPLAKQQKTGSANFFIQKLIWLKMYWFCQYRKDGQYHCQTDILCLYRKSIQLNAISKVTLLVQDPMWFLNDLLMVFKVAKKKEKHWWLKQLSGRFPALWIYSR